MIVRGVHQAECGAGTRAPRGPVVARVERTATFQRVLGKLRSVPGRPAEAARKAERILACLAAVEGLIPREAGSLTRYGDARVPGCVKYELGGGYRLICRRRGGVLVALYLGNHEECHSWLKVSRGLEGATGDVLAPDSFGEPRDRYEGDDFALSPPVVGREYTDRELRAVFAGLCSR